MKDINSIFFYFYGRLLHAIKSNMLWKMTAIKAYFFDLYISASQIEARCMMSNLLFSPNRFYQVISSRKPSVAFTIPRAWPDRNNKRPLMMSPSPWFAARNPVIWSSLALRVHFRGEKSSWRSGKTGWLPEIIRLINVRFS